MGAVVDLGTQLISNGFDFSEVDWGEVGLSAIGGAVSSGIGSVTSSIAGKCTSTLAKVAVQAIGGGTSAVASDIITGKAKNATEMVDSFLSGSFFGAISEFVSIKVAKYRTQWFENLGKAGQKDILKNKVFKEGNYYYHWTWNGYANTSEYKEYIERFDEAIDFSFGVLAEIFN